MRTSGQRGWGGFVVILVGGFAAAFFFGRTTEPAEYEPQPLSTTGTPGTPRAALDYDAPLEEATPAPAQRAAAPGEVREARVAELQREIAAYEQLAAAYEEELYGLPYAWPEEVPEHLSPAGFEVNLREAVADCGAGVEVTGFDCSEPPCFALLRIREEGWRQALVHDCPAWGEHYGTTTSGASFKVECAGGGEERVEMLGMPLKEVVGEEGVGERGNMMKRLKARMKEQELRWTCLGEEG